MSVNLLVLLLAALLPSVDVAFIDGDHSFAGASADVRSFLPRTRYVLSGHDFAPPTQPGVPQALVELLLANGTALSRKLAGPISLEDDCVWWAPLAG